MILTFTLFGQYLTPKMMLEFNKMFLGYLVQGGICVALAGIVIFVLLKEGESSSNTPMNIQFNLPTILLLVSQLALVQIYNKPVGPAIGHSFIWYIIWTVYFAAIWILTTYLMPLIM